MAVDPNAVQAAARVLQELLQKAAEEQRAYFHSFPDGNISLELEWIDLRQMTHAAITAYLLKLRESESDDRAPKAVPI